DLEDLQTGQAAQLQFHDGVGLRLVEIKTVHDGLPRLGKAALAGADGGDDLVHDVHGFAQAFQDVFALLGFFQVVGRAAADDFHLEVDVPFHHGFQAHDAGHAVVQRQHDDAHGVLQLGVAVQLVEHHLGVGVLLDLNDDLHAGAAGTFVVEVRDALDALVLDEVGDGLDQAGLVDHIGDLGDEDLIAAVFLFHDLGAAAQGDLAAAGGVGGPDAGPAHDDAAGGEVGA